jgi:hypothetical protein
MSEESVRDLFNRWERVWHEGRYDLVAECLAQVYIRHDESGTRRVTPEECKNEVAAMRRERPNTRFVVYDHDIAGDRAWFCLTLMWADPSTGESRTRAGLSNPLCSVHAAWLVDGVQYVSQKFFHARAISNAIPVTTRPRAISSTMATALKADSARF